jgi:paraquat-inducible protein B
VLYPTQADADAGAIGPEVPYAFSFNGPGGDLTVGAPVRLLGFSVGVVRSVRLVVDAASGASHTDVVAALFPRRLHLREAEARLETKLGAAPNSAAVQMATDALVTRLLAQGYRAQLVQKPPLIGGRIIVLERSAGARPAALGAGKPRQFPSVDASGGVDETMGQINELLAKINRVPIEAIGQDIRQAAGSLNKLVSSPQLTESLRHLNGTLAQAEQMMNSLQPQVGPLMGKLNSAADEVNRTAAAARGLLGSDGSGAPTDASLPEAIRQLNDAARAIRTLSDYLGRHPESLIRGRRDAPAAAPAGTKDTP